MDLTTSMVMPEVETTEFIQVLPETTTAFSLEQVSKRRTPFNHKCSIFQLSKNLHALVLNRHSHKHKSPGANFFQPGEPENEAELYTSTTRRRTRRTRPTTDSTSIETTPTTELPYTTLLSTPATSTTTSTIEPSTTTILPTTTNTPLLTTAPTTTMITQSETTINLNPPQSRIGGSQRRRNNMTLFILTSDEHKIRQFSVNHTRGILINCNQLRRRLLGRRRLRETPQTSSTPHPAMIKNCSRQTLEYHLLLSTIFSLVFLGKIMI